MQTLWSRALQSRCSCHCASCLSKTTAVARRATTHTGRRVLRPGPSSTLLYSTIFAAAVVADGKAKEARREQWDRAIAKAKEELKETGHAEAEEKAGSLEEGDQGAENWGRRLTRPWHISEEHWEELAATRLIDSELGMEVLNDGILELDAELEQELLSELGQDGDATDPFAEYWELLRLDTQFLFDGTRPDWPANTGQKFDRYRYHMPPQSLWAGSPLKVTAFSNRIARKKIRTMEMAISRMIHEWILEAKLYDQASAEGEDVPEALKPLVAMSKKEVSGELSLCKKRLKWAQNLPRLLGEPEKDGYKEDRIMTSARELKEEVDTWKDFLSLTDSSLPSSQLADYAEQISETAKGILRDMREFREEAMPKWDTYTSRSRDLQQNAAVEMQKRQDKSGKSRTRAFPLISPIYEQTIDTTHHNITHQMNESLLSLFRKHTSGAITFQQLILSLSHNLISSTAPPNARTYNILITGLARLDQPAFADSAIKSMLDAKVRPNEITCASILNFYTKTNRPSRFNHFVKLMRGMAGGIMLANPHIIITEAGAKRLVPVEGKGKIIQKVHPTPMVFHALVAGVLKFAGFRRAVEVYADLQADGWGLDVRGLELFLHDCVRRADWSGGQAVWEEIQKLRRKVRARLGQSVYASMLALCRECGRGTEFNSVVQEATEAGHTKGALLRKINVGNARVVEGREEGGGFKKARMRPEAREMRSDALRVQEIEGAMKAVKLNDTVTVEQQPEEFTLKSRAASTRAFHRREPERRNRPVAFSTIRTWGAREEAGIAAFQ